MKHIIVDRPFVALLCCPKYLIWIAWLPICSDRLATAQWVLQLEPRINHSRHLSRMYLPGADCVWPVAMPNWAHRAQIGFRGVGDRQTRREYHRHSGVFGSPSGRHTRGRIGPLDHVGQFDDIRPTSDGNSWIIATQYPCPHHRHYRMPSTAQYLSHSVSWTLSWSPNVSWSAHSHSQMDPDIGSSRSNVLVFDRTIWWGTLIAWPLLGIVVWLHRCWYLP